MKAGAVDAQQNFSVQQVNDMKELISVNEEMKALEKKKKVLVDNVKQYMTAVNIMSVDVDGKGISITESQRRTVSSKLKDKFIAALVGKGKKHLVATKIEPDMDGIFAEVDAGALDKDFVEQYVKVTPVLTLRCD